MLYDECITWFAGAADDGEAGFLLMTEKWVSVQVNQYSVPAQELL